MRGLEDGRDVLEDRRHPVDTEARVDVLRRQRGQRAVRVQLVLHEDEIPVLDDAIGVVAGPLVVAAEVGAAVVIEL